MYKSKLQELCHQHSWNLPEYTAVKEGPDHNPKFTATVTVNSVQFHTPSDHQCRSSKEAQNQAAKVAFDHFTAPKSILQHHSSSSSSNSSSPVAPPNPNPNATPPTEISQLYKNRLQIYAQKKNLALPTYSYVADGPPHARRFKSTVTIDDKTYEAAEFCSTVKEAEHAAAKVALESLPSVETHQEDETLYKSLLQELTQKEGLGVPTYETIKSGPPHIPKFLSNVGIKGETFQGQEARTKKQAEMSAAKAAYKALIERSTRKNLALKSQMTDVSQPNATREMQADLEANTDIVIHEGKAEEEKGRSRRSPGGDIKGPREFSYYKVKSSGTDESQPFARAKANILVREKQVEEDTNINATGSKPANSETEVCHRSKVYVCPPNMNFTYHQGSTILPISDDKWVAMKVEIN